MCKEKQAFRPFLLRIHWSLFSLKDDFNFKNIFKFFVGASHCDLPSAWTGRWFESGERDAVTVTSKNITHKGECIHQKGDKYILKDE